MLTYEEALDTILKQVRLTETEIIRTDEALNKTLAEDVKADRDYPPFNRSAMDGIAIRKTDFEKGIRIFKVLDTVFAGEGKTFVPKEGEAIKIMTGAAVPAAFDAVIRREDCEFIEDKVVVSAESVKDKQNIASKGEDLKESAVALEKNTQIKHGELALLATLGKASLSVYKKTSVAIIATGDELKQIDEAVEDFQIRESNTYVLRGLLHYLDMKPVSVECVQDEKEALRKAIANGLKADVLLLTGGVSMGDADFVPEILQQLQVEKVFHKSAIKPGKPMWFGKHANGFVFALPGNPLSVQATFKLYVEPFIKLSKGCKTEEIEPDVLKFSESMKKKNTLDVFFPVKLKNGQAYPVQFNGSGDVKASVGSDGLARFKADLNELKEGDEVEVFVWRG